MRQAFVTVSASAVFCLSAHGWAQSSTWALDPDHAHVDFQVRRVPVSNVRGSFSGITGKVRWDETDPSKSSVEAIIPIASVSTNNGTRDNDLKSSNFFDVHRYPTMTFKSTFVIKVAGKLQVVGNLTLAGVTKSVILIVDGPTRPTKMGSKVIIGFEATGIIKRSDFNFAPKYPTAILGDEIKFTIDVEADS